jgi:hypothetical protein
MCELLLRMQTIEKVNNSHLHIVCQVLIQSIKIAKREAETGTIKDAKNPRKKIEPLVAKNIFDQSTNIVFSYLPDLLHSFS